MPIADGSQLTPRPNRNPPTQAGGFFYDGLLISDRGSTPRLTMPRQSASTNATPLAPLDKCPHRDAYLRSAARHCRPPITRPSFMSRLERIRTIPVVYGGNRAVLFEKEVRSRAAGLAHALARIGRHMTSPPTPGLTSGLARVMEGLPDYGRRAGLNRVGTGAYSSNVRAATNFRGAEKSRVWLGS